MKKYQEIHSRYNTFGFILRPTLLSLSRIDLFLSNTKNRVESKTSFTANDMLIWFLIWWRNSIPKHVVKGMDDEEYPVAWQSQSQQTIHSFLNDFYSPDALESTLLILKDRMERRRRITPWTIIIIFSCLCYTPAVTAGSVTKGRQEWEETCKSEGKCSTRSIKHS